MLLKNSANFAFIVKYLRQSVGVLEDAELLCIVVSDTRTSRLIPPQVLLQIQWQPI
jgi:hypothetical protein